MAFIKLPFGSKLTFILILPFFLLWAADIKVLRGRLILLPYYHPRSGLFRIYLDAYDDPDTLMGELLFRFYYKFYFPNPNHLVIDVGANIGDFCIPLSRHVREVIAIEGYPPTYYRLVKNIYVNKCHNITAFFTLAGDVTGVGYIREGRSSGGSHIVLSKDTDRTYEVALNTLDTLLKQKPDVIDLLKIDVEGSDGQVLLGAREALRRTHRVIIEIHDRPEEMLCKEILIKSGFHVIVHKNPLGYPNFIIGVRSR